MTDPAHSDPLRFFSQLPDPRSHNIRYRLIDLIVIALMGMICDADGWDDLEDFARAKHPWLSSFLELKHGVPSADTFRRVFSRLDPDAFENAFVAWMNSLSQTSAGKLVAIDGKSIRRSFERSWDKLGMAHMVSAFASENGQVIGQLKAACKGNELETIHRMLAMLELKSATVTIDAIGCQKDVAKKIIEADGDYVLAVKDNQPTLHKALRVEFDDMLRHRFHGLPFDHHEQVDAGHGRIETRRVWVLDQIDWLKQRDQWAGLRSVAMVESEREAPGHGRSVERRYFISSLPADAKRIAAAVRGHWAIENSLHHVLDVSFHEDESRVRAGHGPENLSRLRRITLNLLKVNGARYTRRGSIKGRRKIAGWDHDFLLKVVTG